MSVTTINKLIQERKSAFAEAEDIKKRAATEEREMTAEERGKVKEIFSSIDAITEKIDLREHELKIERQMAAEETTDEEKRNNDKPDAPAEYKDVFKRWIMAGGSTADMTREERQLLRKGEKRAQTTQTDSSGGYLIPEGFSEMLEKRMIQFGGMMQIARVWNTATGNEIPWPTVDDTSNTGAIIAENATDSQQDVAFGVRTFNAYKTTSRIVPVPYELFQDSYFNVERLLADLFGERLGRIKNQLLTTGTGTAQPNGVVTASLLGETAASATAVTYNEVMALKHSVDPAYRQGPSVRYMFNDSTLLALKQLSVGSSDARPLWQPGMAVGEPNTIDGTPYVINQDMADIATGNKSILFGDFSKYVIRQVSGIRMKRSEHVYFENDQTAFVALERFDGECIQPNAIKHLIQA